MFDTHSHVRIDLDGLSNEAISKIFTCRMGQNNKNTIDTFSLKYI